MHKSDLEIFNRGRKEAIVEFIFQLKYCYDFPDYEIAIFEEIANDLLKKVEGKNYDITLL